MYIQAFELTPNRVMDRIHLHPRLVTCHHPSPSFSFSLRLKQGLIIVGNFDEKASLLHLSTLLNHLGSYFYGYILATCISGGYIYLSGYLSFLFFFFV